MRWPRETQVREGDLTFLLQGWLWTLHLGAPLDPRDFLQCLLVPELVGSSQDSVRFYSGAKT